MMITEPALTCLITSWQRLVGQTPSDGHVAADLARSEPERAPSAPRPVKVGSAPAASSAESAPAAREPAMPATIAVDTDAPLTANERRARAAALRALAFSRARRFDAARTAFTEAARLDPLLDLTRTPTFWRLERAAHEAAIAAYAATGRERDATVLRAQVHSTFRPKRLKMRQDPAVTT
jgi:hypothetical protein